MSCISSAYCSANNRELPGRIKKIKERWSESASYYFNELLNYKFSKAFLKKKKVCTILAAFIQSPSRWKYNGEKKFRLLRVGIYLLQWDLWAVLSIRRCFIQARNYQKAKRNYFQPYPLYALHFFFLKNFFSLSIVKSIPTNLELLRATPNTRSIIQPRITRLEFVPNNVTLVLQWLV